jgi:hypothetical protein
MQCHGISRHQFLSILQLQQSTVSSSGLHIFIMSTQDLYKGGKQLPVYLSPGSVVTFKSTLFDLSVLGFQTSCLDLYNDIGDIALRITLRGGQNKIFCNDYTSNLQRGWGKERSADLDVNWQSQGATISVYYFLTDSKLTRYQILVNLTTVCYFDSRLRGPLVQLGYLEHPLTLRSILSNPLRVVCCAMLDLQPEERRAIQSGG